jgi:O-antigen/teichoic acid export membrane protein
MVFISLAVTGALQLTLTMIFIKGPGDLLKVPLIYFVGAIPITIIFLRRMHFKFKISLDSFKKMSFYLTSSMVIWSISVFAQVYNNLDVFLLGLFRSIEEVGYFTVARRIVGGFSMLMMFLANATLPRLACTFAGKDHVEFRRATHKFVRLSVLLIIFILFPVIVFSRQIIALTVGSYYMPASAPLSIMIAGVALVLFNLPYSTALIAACFEKEVLKQAAASAALSIFLNFALIPKYGMIGASISFLSAEALALGWILWIYDKKIRAHIHNQKGVKKW